MFTSHFRIIIRGGFFRTQCIIKVSRPIWQKHPRMLVSVVTVVSATCGIELHEHIASYATFENSPSHSVLFW